MKNEQIVEPGKIITILFNSPSSKPLRISISNDYYHTKQGIVYISVYSPLAQAILNHQQGEKIRFESPEGKLTVKIMGVSVYHS